MIPRGRLSLLAAALAACASQKTTPVPPPDKQHGVELGDLDRAADPCGDFFEFANGAWRKANPIPPSMQRWSRRWQAGEVNKERLKEILDEVSKKTDWPKGSVEQVVGDDYASCMDEKRADAAGLSPLSPVLTQIDGVKSRADLQAAIHRVQELNVNAPFLWGGQPDPHEPPRTIAIVAAAGLGLPDRDYYLKPEPRFVEAREKYRAHVENIFRLAGEPQVTEAAETVFAFEKRLAEASLDNVALRDPKNTDHPVSFAQLQAMTPHFDWTAQYAGARVPQGDLNVAEPKFLAQIDQELAQTPVPAWRTYLKWQLLASAAPWLSKPFADESFAFNQKYLGGVPEQKPRWKRCAESVDELLGEALGRKYVERYFPPAAKARVQDLVRNELSAMKEIIERLAWMGPETKRRALEKLATFNPKIGYPDKWKDYSGVEIRRDAPFWDNVVQGRKFVVADTLGTIGKPTDRGRWGMTPPTSNAYYNPLLNEVVFPAGILQAPAFDVAATDAVNYGAIGVVIGHEISHGFDDQGAQFDAEGRLKNWWTEADLKSFQERGRCVVDQFEAYFIEPGIHHNGKLVLGESIGDLAGAKIAWLAFQKAQQTRPAVAIDGFSPAQQFFIAWGQFRGDETRPETQRLMVQGDPHPVAKYRVIGPLSNIPEFAKTFGCKADSAMVRAEGKRCEVW
ncbi:MAG TPA: M13 family metallopeptidase [Myxococcales bacterium]|nr:M13 family metallopeptidase [Myxococcales bacterium]